MNNITSVKKKKKILDLKNRERGTTLIVLFPFDG